MHGQQVPGVVLAGGRSLRMGEDKRHLRLGATTLLEWACRRVRRNFDRAYVSVNTDFSAPRCCGLPVIRDLHPGQGPLLGMYSVLTTTGVPGGVFLPVDMPFVPDDLLRWIAHQAYTCDVLYFHTGRIQPFPGYYSRVLLPHMAAYLSAGRRSLQGFLPSLERIRIRVIPASVVARFGPVQQIFCNLNTPQDLLRARAWDQTGFR